MFFIISGMMTFDSIEKVYVRNNGLKHCILKWFAKKILYFMPMYYMAIVLCLMITHGNEYWYGAESRVIIYNILSHLTFTNGLFPHYANSIIGVEWYLSTLVVFYVLLNLFRRWKMRIFMTHI